MSRGRAIEMGGQARVHETAPQVKFSILSILAQRHSEPEKLTDAVASIAIPCLPGGVMGVD
ncbi:hypothetical protein X772_35720 [Mesorhizobium sp. LSJC280B00]|nr:hypothetical protein X772_35720 [Mesorhizobium sp. LSJC280B00]